MKKDYDYQKIEDYVLGRLDNSEKKKFEEQIKSDATLAEEVDFYRGVTNASEANGERDFLNMLQETESDIGEDFFSQSSSQDSGKTVSIQQGRGGATIHRLSPRRLLSLAATMLILVIAGNIWYANTAYSNNTLLSEAETDYYSLTRNGNNLNGVFAEGFNYLSAENYQEAIIFFEKFAPKSENYPAAQLNLGFAQYQAGLYDEAAATAQKAKKVSVLKKNQATWLEIQSLLAAEKTDARFYELVNTLAADTTAGEWRNKAVKLKEKLDSFWRGMVW